MLNIPVSQIILDQPRVHALVSQGKLSPQALAEEIAPQSSEFSLEQSYSES